MWSCQSSFGLLPWNDSPKLILRTPTIVTQTSFSCIPWLKLNYHTTNLPGARWVLAGEKVTPDWRETKELLLGFFLQEICTTGWRCLGQISLQSTHLLGSPRFTITPAEFPHFECSPSSKSYGSPEWCEHKRALKQGRLLILLNFEDELRMICPQGTATFWRERFFCIKKEEGLALGSGQRFLPVTTHEHHVVGGFQASLPNDNSDDNAGDWELRCWQGNECCSPKWHSLDAEGNLFLFCLSLS